MVIVTVRAAAKITHLEALLVKSNLVYFVAMCVISFLFGFAVAALWWRFAVKQKHLAETEAFSLRAGPGEPCLQCRHIAGGYAAGQ